MSETVTLLPEEIDKLRAFQAQYASATKIYGELYFQSRILSNELGAVSLEMDRIEQERVAMLVEFEKKYGVGQVDINTGIFVSAANSGSQ